MSKLNNCPATTPGAPAQAVSPTLEAAHEFINDWFTDDPKALHDMRGNLRTWFVNNLLEWEDNFGTTLANQVLHYELLDQLIGLLIINASNKSAK